MRVNRTMRGSVLILSVMAPLGFCVRANAQAQCPELTLLRSEAQETLRRSRSVPAWERCYMYHRLSLAWGAVAQYATENRESCHVSVSSLSEFERYHREAVAGRDNVCAGRPLRPFPPDIIQR
jgi:hypothetical protein